MEEVYDRDLEEYSDRIKERALEAFRDDLNGGDITTEAVFAGEDYHDVRARIISEEDCRLAGVMEARAILEEGGLRVSGKEDGEDLKPGDVALEIEGPLKEVLARERVVLNYIIQMSGIATVSRKLFRRHGKKILFLRKTNPGLLFSEKRAVQLGGCLPHRTNLSDGILIKDNHLAELMKKKGREDAIRTAISRADDFRKSKRFLPIEIEADSLEDARIAAEELSKLDGPNMIMLDNMAPEQVREASKLIKSISKKIIVEASGGIKERSIRDYLGAGVDYISTSLFVSAKSCKFKMEVIR